MESPIAVSRGAERRLDRGYRVGAELTYFSWAVFTGSRPGLQIRPCCRMSESPCRLIRLWSPASTQPNEFFAIIFRIRGWGANWKEFLELDALARETPVEKWDGTLLITTTGTFSVSLHGINDEAIYRYRINLQEEISSARLSKLATTYRNHARFSGTEVCLCLSNDADVDDFILWLVGFFRKIQVIKAAVSFRFRLSTRQTAIRDTPMDMGSNRPTAILQHEANNHWKVSGFQHLKSIAGLIWSSTNEEFQDECIGLLGLGSEYDVSEGPVRSSICEKMIHIIEMNDTKENAEDNVPYLFECEKLDGGSELDAKHSRRQLATLQLAKLVYI
ncbi:Type 2 DNA topoisomerase 6 subunit B-like [Zea mays]|uniref:Type 2 DNA topoisomerase 6 subunit B-like n=1 Tax=Zea mays TaxID=4577 RepID=A0A1D6LN82_MAIZE|nr:Type 2 DNA topoisomerase 6 subunit B-like [Zea mays]